MNRRRQRLSVHIASLLLLFISAVALSGCERRKSSNEADSQTIRSAESFAEDAQRVATDNRPIVVLVSQHGCQYCELLRRQVLHPMLRAGEFQRKAILREVSLDAGFSLDDFDGTRITGSEFAARYAAHVTPTVIFLDADGTELAEPIVGISNIEFYGFYLENALQMATANISGQRH